MTEVYTEIFNKDLKETIDSFTEIKIEDLDLLQVCSIIYLACLFPNELSDEKFFVPKEVYGQEYITAIIPLMDSVLFRHHIQYKEKNIHNETGKLKLPNMVFLPKYTKLDKAKFIVSLFDVIKSGLWPEKWFNQLYSVWNKIYVLDCFYIYSWYGDRFKLPVSNEIADIKDIANMAFNKYSLSEFTYIAWYVSRDTAAFIREKGIRSDEKIFKILLTKYNKYLNISEKESWQAKKFDQIEGMPDIWISNIFHDDILKHGTLEGFKTKPYKILKSDIISRGVVTKDKDIINKLNDASSLDIILHLDLIPTVIGGQYDQKSRCSPKWYALSTLEHQGLNLPIEILITNTLDDGTLNESNHIMTYDNLLHSDEISYKDFLSKQKLNCLKEEVSNILKTAKNYLLETINSIPV